MKTFIKQISIFFVLVCLLGCATGTKFTELAPLIQKLPENKGRIYFYRDDEPLGILVQPNIILNGEVVGEAILNGFFYVDRDPGLYEISIATEAKRTRSLILEKGQIVYVRLRVFRGLFIARIYPDIVDAEIGAKWIQKCRYTGREK